MYGEDLFEALLVIFIILYLTGVIVEHREKK